MSDSIAPLHETYAADTPCACRDIMLPTFTITPPPYRSISSAAQRAMKAGDVRQTRIVRSHSAGVISRIVLSSRTAALLTSTSSRPKAAATCRTTDSAKPRSPRSPERASTRPPAASMRRRTSSSRLASRPTIPTA